MRFAALPPPGISSDDTDFAAPGVWASGSNVRFYRGKPESIGNQAELQSGALETYSNARKLFVYKVAGAVKLAVAGNSLLYSVNVSTWARTDITPASGWGLGAPSLDMFGDILLASTEGDTIFRSTAGAQAVAIANAPDDVTKMIVTPSRQVMALGCNEETSGTFNGRCIRWCDIEDYDDWTTLSSNNAGEYILPGQEDIVTGCVLGDYIIVWTTGSTWLGQYIGQPGQTYIFTRIDAAGCVAHGAYTIYDGAVYFMDPSFIVRVYRVGGAPTYIPCPTSNTFFGEVVSSAAGSFTHAFTHRKHGEVWFFYPTTAGATAFNYIAYCVNESAAQQRPVWFKGTMDAAAVVDNALLQGATNMGDSTRIRAGYSSAKKLTAFDRQDGAGTPISWNINSSWFYADEGHRRVQVQRFTKDFERQDASVDLTVNSRDDPADGNHGLVAVTVGTADDRENFRISGKLVSYSLTGTDLWRLGKPTFDAVTLGYR